MSRWKPTTSRSGRAAREVAARYLHRALATLSPATLSGEAQRLIADPANTILVSSASAWEIATKVRLGKLPGAERLESSYLEVMESAGYTELAIDLDSALRVGRILVAQAIGLDIPVITPDVQFDSLGVRRIW